MFDNSHKLTTVIWQWWNLVDTFHDIFDLQLYVRSTMTSEEEYEAVFADDAKLANKLNTAFNAMKVGALLKVSDICMWLQDPEYGWFALMLKQGIREHPAAPHSKPRPCNDLPIASIPRKRTSQSSGSETSFNWASSAHPVAHSVQSGGRSASGSVKQPSQLNKVSTMNKEDEEEPVDDYSHPVMLGEMLCHHSILTDKNNKLGKVLEKFLKRTGQPESAVVCQDMMEYGLNGFDRIAQHFQAERDAACTSVHRMMEHPNATQDAILVAQQFHTSTFVYNRSSLNFPLLMQNLREMLAQWADTMGKLS
ncbi:hypothetical protein FS749_012092 [Ceratobasidium sp. UAMH 11750]|nr:hypothetical protein FS749_012092 [Ceratobasidium sp. UAMH 11750]